MANIGYEYVNAYERAVAVKRALGPKPYLNMKPVSLTRIARNLM
jgi:hypothetical protein